MKANDQNCVLENMTPESIGQAADRAVENGTAWQRSLVFRCQFAADCSAGLHLQKLQ
ncbi:hypothetical protein P4C99_04970 [Pontiellaceae bacterium B1224]|nr:hypothetical protein [Pontiellaceae bacterium B1224]